MMATLQEIADRQQKQFPDCDISISLETHSTANRSAYSKIQVYCNLPRPRWHTVDNIEEAFVILKQLVYGGPSEPGDHEIAPADMGSPRRKGNDVNNLTELQVPWAPQDTTDRTPKPPDEPTMEELFARLQVLFNEIQGIIIDVRAKVAAL